MNIKWFTKDNTNSAVTVYNNNITLSKQAVNFFEDAYAVAVGIDIDKKNLVIKKYSKDDIDQENSEHPDLHKISIKSSYGRINSKQLVNEISEKINLDFKKQASYKFAARWNTGSKMLIVSTKEDEDYAK